MTNRLEELLNLQAEDTTLSQLHHRRTHLPEAEEVARLEGTLRYLEGERVTTQAALDGVAANQAEAESELATVEARAATINKRMYGGEVSASKDLQAMAAEIDHLKERSSTLEDTILERLEEREPLEARLSDLAAEIARVEAEQAEAAGRLADAEAAVDAEIAAAAGKRQVTAAGIDAQLLDTYDRLRGRLGGVGVARLVGNHCDGCHLTLSSAELDRVRHLGEGELYFCEQCSRILVP